MTRDRRFLLLLACFALSGLAALIYETAWTQQLALVFGTSELAVATVLAAYMAGLTAGAVIAGRWVDRARRPIRLYALLELGIAASALAVPPALGLAGRLHVALLGGLEVPPEAGSLASALFYLAASFAVLFVPTALMGATLPLLARYAVRSDRELGRRVGLLYTANTAGAAGGTLLAAFVLLPGLGLGRTILVAVGVNVLVFLLAALLARGRQPATAQEATAGKLEPAAGGFWILPLILVSGFVSFSWEVLWTRLLSHLLGGSIYAFGTMLATFLAGIGIGSAAAGRWAADRPRAWRGFAVAQLGVAACSYAAFALADRLPRLVDDLAASGGAFSASAPLAAATLLPGALFIGATFPFAVRVLAGDAAQAGPASARVFAWNTLGAIAGAIVTGFLLLPGLRFAGAAAVATAISLGLALAASLLARPRRPALAVVAAGALAVLATALPRTPWQVLRHSPLTGQTAAGEVTFYGVGRSATVLLTDRGGEWRLTTDGLPEAAIERRGARPSRFALAQWLALLPQAVRPEIQSMLIVGLGAGVTVEAVPPAVEEVHVVELEPEVVHANRSKAAERRFNPLADPRVSLHVNDARSALALSQRRYDAIVSQPSHPWTGGASHLFTREFFVLAREHLEPRGVFSQWIGLRFVDADLLRSLVATLADVFPYVEVYRPFPGGGVLFLCGREPLAVAETAERALAASPRAWGRLGVFVLEDVLAERLLDAEGSRRFAGGETEVSGAPELNTDAHNLLMTRAPRILRAPLGAQGVGRLLAELDPLNDLPRGADGLYLVRRLIRQKAVDRARRLAESLDDPDQRRIAQALVHLASGRPRLGRELLLRELELEAPAVEAFHALLLLDRQTLQRGDVTGRLGAHLVEDARAAAVVEGWRLARLGTPLEIRRLEPDLAAIGPRHSLAGAATALRITWRQASGDPARAREALTLLEPTLAYGERQGSGLIRRARLAAAAAEPETAVASLLELAVLLGRQDRRQPALEQRTRRQVREAREVLRSLPVTVREDPSAMRLEADLRGLAEAAS